MKHSAYLDALKLLARRELTEAQVRDGLARRSHAPDDIDQAVDRLKDERALDDARVAEAMARFQVSTKHRGRLRVIRHLEAAGIDRQTASQAIDRVFEDTDADTLIDAALERRLRGRERLDDERDFQRLFRYLIGQGFEPDRVSKALASKRRRRSD